MLGHVDIISRELIAGWAADPAKPAAHLQMQLVVNGEISETPADLQRQDLNTVFENSTGRYGFRLKKSPLPLSPFIDHNVEVRFMDSGKLVPGGKSTIRSVGTPLSESARTGQITPIVITTTGRSGSSLLMARLARHPDILVGRSHPYELKLLSYYALALNTLISGADRERSTNPDNMLAARRFFVGFNPYNDERDSGDPVFRSFWNETCPDALRACFVALIDAYYSRISQQTAKPSAKYFAEKVGTSDLARHSANFMYGRVHEILLVRDPRDIICSAKSFWRRSFEDSVNALQHGFNLMNRPRTEAGLRQHVVRYEDLIARPHSTMKNLYAFLGLVSDDIEPDGDEERRVFQLHGTCPSPEETLGRWRGELTSENLAVVNRDLSDFLIRYGYESGSELGCRHCDGSRTDEAAG